MHLNNFYLKFLFYVGLFFVFVFLVIYSLSFIQNNLIRFISISGFFLILVSLSHLINRDCPNCGLDPHSSYANGIKGVPIYKPWPILTCPHCGYAFDASTVNKISERKEKLTDYFDYAGFWIRALASIFDVIFLFVFLTLILVIFVPVFLVVSNQIVRLSVNKKIYLDLGISVEAFISISFLIGLLLFISLITLFFSYFESSEWKASPGKLIFGLKVVDLQESRISKLAAMKRNFIKYNLLISVLGSLSFLCCGFLISKLTLHDYVTSTRVVKIKQDDTSFKLQSYILQISEN